MVVGAAFGCFISGLILLGFVTAIRKLCQIEYYLRPAGMAIPEVAVIYCACGQMTLERAKERGHICKGS